MCYRNKIQIIMKILGIDYGRSKIGLATSEESLASPWKVVRVKNFEDAVSKVNAAFTESGADTMVVGVSEGEMGTESLEFAKKLRAATYDETLTSLDAQAKSREAGISQKKRREMEDAYAAAIMLQNYLDNS